MTNKTIWKFTLPPGERPYLIMPVGALILHCKYVLDDDVCLWAIVDPTAERERRYFRVYGTGDQFESQPWEYVGTVHQYHYVWHIFDDTTGSSPSPTVPRNRGSNRESLAADHTAAAGARGNIPGTTAVPMGVFGQWSPVGDPVH